jgi:hypothetical protein
MQPPLAGAIYKKTHRSTFSKKTDNYTNTLPSASIIPSMFIN